MTQRERILEHLANGNTITSLQAYDQLGVTQLAARVYELRDAGHCIRTNQIKVTNRFGEECSVSEYYLEEA